MRRIAATVSPRTLRHATRSFATSTPLKAAFRRLQGVASSVSESSLGSSSSAIAQPAAVLNAVRHCTGQNVAGSYQGGMRNASDPYEGVGGNFAVVIGPNTTIVDLWKQAVRSHLKRRFMGSKMYVRGRLGYVWSTYESVDREIEAVRHLLAKQGLQRGDRLAIVSENRYEFFTLLMATMQLGAQPIILPTNITPSEARTIIKNSHTKIMVVESLASHTAVRSWVGHVGELQHVLCLEQQVGDDAYSVAVGLAQDSLTNVMSVEGAKHPNPIVDPKPDDTALICFTAGTTGVPKGVMLTHKAMIASISSCGASLGEAFTHTDLFCSLASWTMVASLTAELFQVIVKGASIAIPPDVIEGFVDLHVVNPTVIVSIATPFIKAYCNIADDVLNSGIIKSYAMKSTLGYLTDARVNYAKPGFITRKASSILLDKYKQQFGEKLRCAVIIGQGLQKDHIDLFNDLDIFVVQTYGVTEAAGLLATDVEVNTRLKVMPGVELRIVNDDNQVVVPGDIGEILVEAPHAMQGYFHTHVEASDAQNSLVVYGSRTFVRTGDFGTLTGGWLTVKGHKDVLITLKNGKVIDPIEPESILIKSPFIRQCFLYGDGRDYVVALVNPVSAAISDLLKKVDRRDGQPIVSEREKADVIRTEIRKYCQQISDPRAHPRRFAFVEEFTHVNGFLTNKWTYSRHKIERHYVHYLNALYDESPKFFGYAVDDYDDLF